MSVVTWLFAGALFHLVIGQRPHFLTMEPVDRALVCPNDMAVGFPQNEWFRTESKVGVTMSL